MTREREKEKQMKIETIKYNNGSEKYSIMNNGDERNGTHEENDLQILTSKI